MIASTQRPNYSFAAALYIFNAIAVIPTGIIYGIAVDGDSIVLRLAGAGFCFMGMAMALYFAHVFIDLLHRFHDFDRADTYIWAAALVGAASGGVNALQVLVGSGVIGALAGIVAIASIVVSSVLSILIFMELGRLPDDGLFGLVGPYRWLSVIGAAMALTIILAPFAMLLGLAVSVLCAMIFYRAARALDPEVSVA